MKQYKIILLCDHKWRDLPGLVLVKLSLEKQANFPVSVTIIPRNSIFDHLNNHDADMVCLASSNSPWLLNTQKLHQMGIIVGIIPTEGRPNYGSIAKWSVSREEGDAADFIALWGPAMKEIFDSVDQPNAVIGEITGPPRFDFYFGEKKKYLMSRQELFERLQINENDRIVSISSVFPHAKFFGCEDWQLEDWKRMNFDKIGLAGVDDYKEKIKIEFESRHYLAETISKTAKKFKNLIFVIKCHPFEDVTWWEEKVLSLGENVKFIKNIYIGDLLNSACLHLHRSCTTATEAWLMGVPSIELGFIKDFFEIKLTGKVEVRGASEDATLIDHVVNSQEELETAISDYLASKKILDTDRSAKHLEYLKKWYGYLDGKSSSRVAGLLLNQVKRSKYIGHKYNRLSVCKRKISSLLQRIKRKIFSLTNTAEQKPSITLEVVNGGNNQTANILWDKEIVPSDVKCLVDRFTN